MSHGSCRELFRRRRNTSTSFVIRTFRFKSCQSQLKQGSSRKDRRGVSSSHQLKLTLSSNSAKFLETLISTWWSPRIKKNFSNRCRQRTASSKKLSRCSNVNFWTSCSWSMTSTPSVSKPNSGLTSNQNQKSKSLTRSSWSGMNCSTLLLTRMAKNLFRNLNWTSRDLESSCTQSIRRLGRWPFSIQETTKGSWMMKQLINSLTLPQSNSFVIYWGTMRLLSRARITCWHSP